MYVYACNCKNLDQLLCMLRDKYNPFVCKMKKCVIWGYENFEKGNIFICIWDICKWHYLWHMMTKRQHFQIQVWIVELCLLNTIYVSVYLITVITTKFVLKHKPKCPPFSTAFNKYSNITYTIVSKM